MHTYLFYNNMISFQRKSMFSSSLRVEHLDLQVETKIKIEDINRKFFYIQ